MTTASVKERTASEQFNELLDVVYADLTRPYRACRLKDRGSTWANAIPVTLEPEKLTTALTQDKGMEDIGQEVIVHTPRLGLSLTELLNMLETHQAGKRSLPTGEVTADFKESLQKLDGLGNSGKYILVEDVGRKSLRLVSYPDHEPGLAVVRYIPHQADLYNPAFKVELVVTLAPRSNISIGKDYIIPFWYGRSREGEEGAPIHLLGYRVNDKNRPHVDRNEGSTNNYRIHVDKKEIWELVKDSVSRKMYDAIREVAKNKGMIIR